MPLLHTGENRTVVRPRDFAEVNQRPTVALSVWSVSMVTCLRL